MLIKLIAIGTKMPAWVTQAYQDYADRMPRECRIKLIEIEAMKRTKNADLEKIMAFESEQLLKATEKTDLIIALERQGKAISTLGLSEQISQCQQLGQNLCLLIGGPEGISENALKQAAQLWSLSALTLPHPLVRVIMAEQLYRAMSILQNHPYHR